MHGADGKVGLTHLVRKPVDFAARVAEDDGLGNGESVVKVTQSVEFPVLLLHGDKVLLQSFQCKFVTLDQDSDRVGHELGGHVKNIVGKGGTDDHDLRRRWQVAVDVVDLLSEPLVKELVCFVQDEHLDVPRPKMASSNHISYSSWCARNNVLAVVELANILPNVGATDAGVALHVHIVAQCHNNRLDLSSQFSRRGQDKSLGLAHGRVNNLQHADREGGCLSRAGLGLRDGVASLANLDNGSRLDGGRGFIAVSVDAAEEVL